MEPLPSPKGGGANIGDDAGGELRLHSALLDFKFSALLGVR